MSAFHATYQYCSPAKLANSSTPPSPPLCGRHVYMVLSVLHDSHLIVDLEVREVRDGLGPGDQLPQHLLLRRLVVQVVDEHRTAIRGSIHI